MIKFTQSNLRKLNSSQNYEDDIVTFFIGKNQRSTFLLGLDSERPYDCKMLAP